ncbi:hypothetical protein PV327_008147 [Microctonus hyperodae]|uniref:BTB domain-containing protein n=1 Tax=Microctonus hyperodae TaxID=165561 RepID=A0AA39F2G9_MICHY|nr:hypothetical protein PV327_008147 [Microctonus hyperodae]
MFRSNIQIEHSWHMKFTTQDRKLLTMEPYSASFIDKELPDVKFSIICYTLDSSNCKLIISKTPCRPANATVRIMLELDDKKERVYNYRWTDKCIFECSFSIENPRCRSCGNNPYQSVSYASKCCITWRGFKEPQRSVMDGLHSYLKNLLTVPDLSDIMIVIDEKEILLHKIILAAYSPVFLAMFKAGMIESTNKRIVVTDVEVEVMEKVVEFMYTGTISPVPEYEELLSILKVADKYEINYLKTLCEEKLSEKITIENVFKILEENSLYGGPLLTKSLLYFMVKNKSSIIKLEDFEEFHHRKPELLSNFFISSIGDGNADK